MNIKVPALFTFLLIIVGITSWYALNLAKKTVIQHVVSDTNPDFFMNNVNFVQMDNDGIVQNQIATANVLHYVKDDGYFFTKPFLKMLDKNNQLWEITADSGKSNGNEKVNFIGNVQIQQVFGTKEKTVGTHVTTSAVTIYPDKKIAETNQPVVIMQGESMVNATGARMDFKASKLELLSRVKGQYEAKSK